MRGYGRLIGRDQASRVAKQPRAWPSRELDEPRALIPHAWSAGPGATAQIFLDCRAARGAPPRARSRSILSPPGFRELIVGEADVLTPLDLERIVGLHQVEFN